MNDFINGWSSVCLDAVACVVLGAASFFAVEALMPRQGNAQWLNEAGGNIYGDSNINPNADPTINPMADPFINPMEDPTISPCGLYGC
ncbi:hypothetical protein KR52_05725 [Synechococcus sp. KORDI-52]|uniref:hypothetical protein n=1 Tax=Synechococcus sp. KORDI-52 TaxID=585425 RepID=UPI0004E0999D|nr:hypothetical protein [Synechococcus sp. KORDI-52]AII48640.1 hypothetical protein KR52_05725 [Synechococcus sp. KORDI-52]